MQRKSKRKKRKRIECGLEREGNEYCVWMCYCKIQRLLTTNYEREC